MKQLNANYKIFINEYKSHGDQVTAYQKAYPFVDIEQAKLGSEKLLGHPQIKLLLSKTKDKAA